MKINYGIRPFGDKGNNGKIGNIEIDCTYEEFMNWTDIQHRDFRKMVNDKNPGYMIVGYCPEEPKKGE